MLETNKSWIHVNSIVSHQSCNYKIITSLEFSYNTLIVPLKLVEEDVTTIIFLFDLRKSCGALEFSCSPLLTPTSILGYEILAIPNLAPHISNACV
jgi:hypothetical protein